MKVHLPRAKCFRLIFKNQSLTVPHGKPRQHHSTASCSRFGITTPARAFLLSRRMTQPRECAGSAQPNNLPPWANFKPLYHEAKMLACKGIFARPSIAQPRIARKRRSRYDFAQGKIPAHIITHPTPSVNDAKLRAAITLSAFRNIIPLNTRKG